MQYILLLWAFPADVASSQFPLSLQSSAFTREGFHFAACNKQQTKLVPTAQKYRVHIGVEHHFEANYLSSSTCPKYSRPLWDLRREILRGQSQYVPAF